jgi:hypothetical protein
MNDIVNARYGTLFVRMTVIGTNLPADRTTENEFELKQRSHSFRLVERLSGTSGTAAIPKLQFRSTRDTFGWDFRLVGMWIECNADADAIRRKKMNACRITHV